MTIGHALRAAVLAVAALTLSAASIAAQNTLCAGKPSCSEVSSFVATVTDFRTSVSGRYRIVSTTIRFQNKLNRPVILGYVPRSGVATDDRGNRYEIGSDASVRGMGVIPSDALDVKFVSAAGRKQRCAIRVRMAPGREIYGTAFEVELAIREIDPVAATSTRSERNTRFGSPDSAPRPPSLREERPHPPPRRAGGRGGRCDPGGGSVWRQLAMLRCWSVRCRAHALRTGHAWEPPPGSCVRSPSSSQSHGATDHSGVPRRIEHGHRQSRQSIHWGRPARTT